MKTTYLSQLTRQTKRASAWARIVPVSKVVPPQYSGVVRHVREA